MSLQVAVDDSAVTGTRTEGGAIELSPRLAYLRLSIVNVVLYGPAGAGDRGWVLIDAGIPGSRDTIEQAAAARFGDRARPAAIVLTHGHFDHVGVLADLAEAWDVPVYAHPAERPYLNGTTAYPAADPMVGGGLMALLSPLFPRSPVDVSKRLKSLPADGTVSWMEGWRWIYTPGHTPGHVSLWHEAERTLIAGDAVITTGQESAYEVAVQTPEMHGPPRYFTSDWAAAQESVARIDALGPDLIVSGHGPALRGGLMRQALHTLSENFATVAVPPRHRTEPR